VTGGQAYLELHFNNLPPWRDTYDLCYALSVLQVKCPLPPGKAMYISYKVCIGYIADNIHLHFIKVLPLSTLPVSTNNM